MALSAWKVMIALAGGLIVFAVYVSVFDVTLTTGGAVLTFLLALAIGGLFFVMMRVGYSIGKRFGPDEE